MHSREKSFIFQKIIIINLALICKYLLVKSFKKGEPNKKENIWTWQTLKVRNQMYIKGTYSIANKAPSETGRERSQHAARVPMAP